MGMDVSGKNPTNTRGEYFRASIWSWPGILTVIMQANDTYDLGFDTKYWGSNDGKGLDLQADCDRLADAMQNILDADPDDIIQSGDNTAARVANTFAETISKGLGIEMEKDLSAEKEHVQEFISFLRSCGGFEIW
jgi:hypothetical protein